MSIRDVTGAQLVDALLANSWQVVGERAGVYKRLAVLDGDKRRHVFVVPLNPEYGDYEDLMGAVLAQLEQLRTDGADAHRVLCRLDPGLYR